MTSENSPSAIHANNFNFLRVFLATLVLFAHSRELVFGSRESDFLVQWFGPSLTFGDLAVDGFFILSGFLIAQSWLRQPSAWSYLRKRLRRIVPAFYVCGTLCGAVAAPLLIGWTAYYQFCSWPRFFAGVALLQYRGPNIKLNSFGAYQFNTSAWTIQIEFWCYLTLLMLGCLGLLKRPQAILGVFLLSVSFYLVQPGQEFVARHLYNAYLLPLPITYFRLVMFFLAGASAFLWRERISFTWWGALVAGFWCVFALRTPGWIEPLLVFGLTYLLLGMAFARLKILDWFKTAPDISYGTYLYGFPVQFALAFQFPHIGFTLHFALSLAGSYLCGFLSWHLVEKRFLVNRPAALTANSSNRPAGRAPASHKSSGC